MVSRVRTLAALAIFVAGLGGWFAPPPALAASAEFRLVLIVTVAQDGSLRDRLFGGGRRDEAPAVARFTSEGGPSFILDQSGPRPLLRFEGSREIWALRPTAGVRGDVYYRNDVGEVVLRATRLGGVTLYTHDAPGGLPCAPETVAQPLRLPDHDVGSLFRHLLREAARGGQAMRGELEIRARDVDPDTDDVFGDAATVAVDGIVRMSRTQLGRERLTNLGLILIVEGPGPDARRDGNTLVITIAPRLGPAGRPSSARIIRALAP